LRKPTLLLTDIIGKRGQDTLTLGAGPRGQAPIASFDCRLCERRSATGLVCVPESCAGRNGWCFTSNSTLALTWRQTHPSICNRNVLLSHENCEIHALGASLDYLRVCILPAALRHNSRQLRRIYGCCKRYFVRIFVHRCRAIS
jgi:hypothetical protein